jgi:hypothetical protein
MRDRSHDRINGSAAATFATVCERKLDMVWGPLGAGEFRRKVSCGARMRRELGIRQGRAAIKISGAARVRIVEVRNIAALPNVSTPGARRGNSPKFSQNASHTPRRRAGAHRQFAHSGRQMPLSATSVRRN